MIHLRRRILPLLVPLPAAHIPPIASLHRLLSAAAAAPAPPKPFAVDDYLVATCGLSPEQAIRASKALYRLKSPSKPDAVLAFLAGAGLSRAEIAAAVAADPRILCAKVEKTLACRVAELNSLGLKPSQVASLIPLSRRSFQCSSLGTKFAFWLSVFGSFDKLIKVLRINCGLFYADIDNVVKPNLAFLKQCGIDVVGNPYYGFASRALSVPCDQLRDAVAKVDEFGVPRHSPVFYVAIVTFAVYCQGKVDKNMRVFEELGWTHEDVLVAMRKAPSILGLTEERVRLRMKFLTCDVGLEIPYIAGRPALLLYNLECRLLPRDRLVNFLREKKFLSREFAFYSIASLSEEKFIDRFVRPYIDSVPGLADAYASSCAGCGMHQWDLLCENTQVKRMH